MINNQDLDRVNSDRGKVMTNFAFLELLISNFITYHYFRKREKAKLFFEEIMEESFFNFELKKRLFLKILKKHYIKTYNAFPRKEFQEMQEKRNKIAHGVTYVKLDQIYIRHEGMEYDPKQLINEYDELRKKVTKAIIELPGIDKSKLMYDV